MIIIFGTTNMRKAADLQTIIRELNIDMEVKSLADIAWDRGDIPETGSTLEENSLIKAEAIFDFCQEHHIDYPIITDDAGLFVEALNGEPGVRTARYADEEIAKDPSLPKYECVNKVLRKLQNETNRNAYYKCVVTCMYPNGTYFQESAISQGEISKSIVEPIKKPYFYSVFKLANTDKTFNLLNEDELQDSYRFKALKRVLGNIQNKGQ